ncbi:MAG: polyphosphate polymerase domain-containing protein [Anaerolineae bacterium]|nr:polyphosphate polymerase domain-containing protein [Anaerolineae bacterium]
MRIKQFSRYELKYLLTREQVAEFVEILPNYVKPDDSGDAHGRYSITSLYHDTDDYRAYWDKIEGHKFRRKVRIRVYGDQTVTPETSCFVEIKQRINKTLQKKRVVMAYTSAEALCSRGETVPEEAAMSETDREIVSEIRYLQATLQLQPACVVSYDRRAFNGSEYEDGLRITFDTNLKGRTHDLTLLSTGHAVNQFFAPPEWCIMEIKVNYRVPYWLTEMIGRYNFTLRRISKYCAALERSKSLLQTQRIVY